MMYRESSRNLPSPSLSRSPSVSLFHSISLIFPRSLSLWVSVTRALWLFLWCVLRSIRGAHGSLTRSAHFWEGYLRPAGFPSAQGSACGPPASPIRSCPGRLVTPLSLLPISAPSRRSTCY